MTIILLLAWLAPIAFTLLASQPSVGASTDYKKRLIACGSPTIGGSLVVKENSRLSIYLPRDIYPTKILKITRHGATARYIFSAGNYGYSFKPQGKPNCWSYYFEFGLTSANTSQSGTLDFTSMSASQKIPNYLVHVKVVVKSPPPVRRGTIQGRVLLSPTCPVERIPPDPACAPKPYITKVALWNSTTGVQGRSVATDSSGSFTLSLDPGNYVLQAASGSVFPRCSDLPVKVTAGTSQKVIINCDTGMR